MTLSTKAIPFYTNLIVPSLAFNLLLYSLNCFFTCQVWTLINWHVFLMSLGLLIGYVAKYSNKSIPHLKITLYDFWVCKQDHLYFLICRFCTKSWGSFLKLHSSFPILQHLLAEVFLKCLFNLLTFNILQIKFPQIV